MYGIIARHMVRLLYELAQTWGCSLVPYFQQRLLTSIASLYHGVFASSTVQQHPAVVYFCQFLIKVVSAALVEAG